MKTYILIEWPESQDYMEESWFGEEAILAIGKEDITGSSAYFIPEDRLINNQYILERSVELALKLISTEDEEDYIEWCNGIPFEGDMNAFESVLNLKLIYNGKKKS